MGLIDIPPCPTLRDRMVFDGFDPCLTPFLFYGAKDWGSNFYAQRFNVTYPVLLFMPWVTNLDAEVRTIWTPDGEHIFQAAKATHRNDFIHIMQADTPMRAKERGKATALRPDWEDLKYQIMVWILRSKFAPDDMRRKLLRTGKRPIYEDSPRDDIWGVRRNHKPAGTPPTYDGQNLLGRALMQVREELR